MNGIALKRGGRAMVVFACAVMIAVAVLMADGYGQAHAYASAAQSLSHPNGTIAISVQKSGNQTVAFYTTSNSTKKPRNVKLSNKNVAKAQVQPGLIMVTMKKPGAIKLSYRWGGKSHTVTIRGYKYANPVKSLKIGGRQYAKKFSQTSVANLGSLSEKGTCPTGKLQVVAAKNWKVKKIMVSTPQKTVSVKNGVKISCAKTNKEVLVCLCNSKTKVTQWVSLGWY